MLDKYIFIVLLIIAIAVNAFYCIRSGRSRNPRIWRVHTMMGTAIIAMLTYIVLLVSKNYTVVYVAYALYYCSVDLILFFLVRFATEFTFVRRRHDSKLLWLKAIIVLLQFVNCFTQILFSVGEKYYGGETYLKPFYTTYFHFHVILCLALATVAIAVFIYKVFTSPIIYWKNGFYCAILSEKTFTNRGNDL